MYGCKAGKGVKSAYELSGSYQVGAYPGYKEYMYFYSPIGFFPVNAIILPFLTKLGVIYSCEYSILAFLFSNVFFVSGW